MLALSRIHETLFYEATLPNADEISKYRLRTEMEKFRRLRKLRTLNVRFEVKRIYLIFCLPISANGILLTIVVIQRVMWNFHRM